jgi:hypothetical protein
MLDSFDHGREEEPGDERASLLGEGVEGGGGGLEIGEEEEEFQDSSCSEEPVMPEIYSAEQVLQSDGSPLSSPPVQEPTPGALAGGDDMRMNKWQCDFQVVAVFSTNGTTGSKYSPTSQLSRTQASSNTTFNQKLICK